MLYPCLSLTMIFVFFSSIFKTPVTFKDSSVMPISTPKFTKLLYIVIDGLRFDAVVPVNKKGLYFNNFTFFQDPERLKTTYLSISGIPTATTPRIISLMTGAPSSQMEEIMTFLQQGVSMDCLCNKFSKESVCAYGDDLWKHSFSIFENNNKCFPGFSKKETVKVEEEMVKNIQMDKHKDIKFIHFLSIDSFGHTYGTDSTHIKDSQVRIDNFLTSTYESMDEDTLMVVLSDHGVTDLGAHGGNSREELSAFCGFYAKETFVDEEYSKLLNDMHIYNKDLLSRNFDIGLINTKDDYIKATEKYRVIHQDDILPTVCYFLGKPVPTNTYGSFIPYLVKDDEAQRKLLRQKMRFLKDSEIRDSFRLMSIEEKNYFVSQKIYNNAVSTRPMFAIVSFSLAIALFYLNFIELKQIVFSFPYLFITFMVSHSYYSFASEDVLWTIAFLVCNFSLSNLVCCIYFLRTAGRYFFASDKIDTKLVPFENNLQRCYYLAIYFILRSIRLRITPILSFKKWTSDIFYKSQGNDQDEVPLNFQMISESEVNKHLNESTSRSKFNMQQSKLLENSQASNHCNYYIYSRIKTSICTILSAFEIDNKPSKCLASILPQLYYVIINHFYPFDDTEKMHFVLHYFSLDTLMTVHYPNEISLIFIFFLKILNTRKTANTKMILLSLVSYFNGFEKVLQSVDYNVFYSYSTEFGSLSNLTGVLAQFIVPRIYIYKKMGRFREEDFLQLYSLVLCLICSWFMNGSLVFSYFFVGRLFSVVLFFIIDLLVDRIYRSVTQNTLFIKMTKALLI